MNEKLLYFLNENKNNIFFVRIPLSIKDNRLSLINVQEEDIIDILPRKYTSVIKLNSKFYYTENFNFKEIPEEFLEYKRSILLYYSNAETYRFVYSNGCIYLDVDELSGYKKYCSESKLVFLKEYSDGNNI